MTTKMPIHDAAKERLMLSCAMRDEDAHAALCEAFSGSEEQPFIDTVNATVWAASQKAKSVDIADVACACPTGTTNYVTEVREIFGAATTAVNWPGYLAVLKDNAMRRKLERLSLLLPERLREGVALDELMPKVIKAFNDADSLTADDADEVMMKEALEAELERRSAVHDKLSTGMIGLDEVLGDLEPGSVIVFAARPAIGKSVCAEVVALEGAKRGQGVGFFTLEMSPAQQAFRMLANMSGVDSRKVPNMLHEEGMQAYQKELYGLPIYYNRRGGYTIDAIESTARRWKRKHDIKYLVIDHFNLLRTNGSDRTKGMNEASERFKTLCRELDVIGVQLVQIGRAGTDAPQIHHLKEAGGIEECADYIVIMHRGELTRADKDNISEGGYVQLGMKVAKNRHGGGGPVEARHYPQFSRIDTHRISDEEVERLRQ